MITTRKAHGGPRWQRHPIAWATAVLILSCGNPTGVDLAPNREVAAVAVDPASSTVIVGADVPLHAVVTDGSGQPSIGATILWSVRDPGIASVSAAGVVTGRAVGTTQVAASAGGKSGTATITVQLPPVASVAVSPAPLSLTLGQVKQISAVVRDAGGAGLSGRAVSWSSANTSVAVVSPDGAVTATGVGTTILTATSEGVSGGTAVTVTPVPVATVVVQPTSATVSAGQTAALDVVLKDAAGTPLDRTDRPVIWSSSDDAVARVSPIGVVTGVAPGRATITATREGVSGTSVVTVVAVPVASVAVQPSAASLIVGESTTLTAAVKDGSGGPLANRVVTWTSSDASVATVTSAGVVAAVRAGSATIAATSEGKTGSATISVVRAPVLTVSVEPATLSIPSGQSRPLTITVTDANHVIVTDRDVAWTSSNGLVASVSANGTVTALAPGSATITATSEGKSTTVQVTVTGAAVGSVTVVPGSVSLTSGQTTTLSATITDANGSVVTDRLVTWSSSNSVIAMVDAATGVVSARAAGAAIITATSEGKAGTATVTVAALPVGSVAIEPTSVTLLPGAAATLTATVRDASGAVVTDRALTWTSSNTVVATVSTTGVVTAKEPGSATVSATTEGNSGSTSVTVSVVPVGSIAVVPAAANVTVGHTSQLASVVKDANDVVVTDRVVTWTSSNDAVARVSPAGLVSGVAPGTATITATSEGKSAAATITVVRVPVGSVAVQASSLAVGQSTTLAATVKDENGTIVTDRSVSWSSSNPAVATVSATTGVVTAVSVGSATITATSEGKSGSATVTVTAVPVASVVVQPASKNLNVGQTAVLSATVTDANGNVVADPPAWTSNNTAVATVSATGVVTAVAPGSATIIASAGGKTGSSNIVVTAVPVGSVVVLPTSASVVVGQTTTLAATIRDVNGAVVTNRPVTWTSSNSAVATVSTNGVVTGVAPGSASITATSETKSASATVTVTPVPVGSVAVVPASKSLVMGTTTTLSATVKDANGAIVTDRVVAWSSNNTAVATVNATTGVVTGVSVGSATITATSEGKSGSAAVTVTSVPVASVTIQPPTASLHVGETAALSVTVKDANGTVVTDRPVTWTSSNTAVASVSTTGVVTALAPGSATISATAEGKTGTSTVAVTPVPVGSVVVQPATASATVGQTTSFTAVVKDANGVVVTDRAVTWASSNTAVATVSGSGVATAVSPGTATITATSEAKSGSAALTVSAAPVGSVTVAPTNKNLVAGTTTTLAVTVRDVNGAVVTDRAVTWSSSNTAVATVGATTGVVTGVAPGTATVTATSETKSGSATVTVTPVPVGSVTVAPATKSLVAGSTTPLTATVKDANGTVVTDRIVTWTSSNTLVATVSTAGVVNALATGSATITATSETKSGSMALTVTPAPVGSVSVLPSSTSLASGQTVQLAATVKDVNGTVVTDRTVTWSTSDNLIATVSTSGLVSTLATGTATITATSETKSGASSVTVTAGPAAAVVVNPHTVSVAANQTVQLGASAKDANGNPITGRAFTWQSNDNHVATVSGTGVVKGIKAGTVLITATLDGWRDSAAVTVTP